LVAGWDVRRTGEGIAAHGRRRQPSNDGRSAPVRAAVQYTSRKGERECPRYRPQWAQSCKLQQVVGALQRELCLEGVGMPDGLRLVA